MMRSKRFTACLLLAFVLSLLLCPCGNAASADDARYTNPDTGYRVWILDDDGLLTTDAEKKVLEAMIPITEYGNIIFWSTSEPTNSEIKQAEEKRYQICGNSSSGILAINMTERYVTFQSDGAIYKMVSKSYARSVTDNVSGYATDGNYCKCAVEAYGQILRLLHGERIAQPMKYISLVLLGLMLAFVLVIGLAFSKYFNPLIKRGNTAQRRESGKRLVGPPTVKLLYTEDRASTNVALGILGVALSIWSDSSGGGGGGSSGGGGGGGSSRF